MCALDENKAISPLPLDLKFTLYIPKQKPYKVLEEWSEPRHSPSAKVRNSGINNRVCVCTCTNNR